jgi:ribosomal protein S18 acetylase RimI-like enzyme
MASQPSQCFLTRNIRHNMNVSGLPASHRVRDSGFTIVHLSLAAMYWILITLLEGAGLFLRCFRPRPLPIIALRGLAWKSRLAKGTASEYLFLFAESADKIAGYVCYGPVSMAQGRFELYWIAVDASRRGQGIGKLLLGRAEAHMRELGGKYVYSETSSRDAYRPTQEFYGKQGFREVARVPLFYADDDDKVIFMKTL